MEIGDRIRKRREELGLTLEEVAGKLLVNRSTVMRYETGKTQRIPLSTIEKLAGVLHTSTGYLMGWSAGEEKNEISGDKDIRIMARMMKGMTPAKKEMLLKIARAMSDIADGELKKP